MKWTSWSIQSLTLLVIVMAAPLHASVGLTRAHTLALMVDGETCDERQQPVLCGAFARTLISV